MTVTATTRFLSVSILLLLFMLCIARTRSFRLTASPALLSSSSRNPQRRRRLLPRLFMSSSPSPAIDCPTIALRNGMEHPAICFGTYKVGFVPASASSAVAAAGSSSGSVGETSGPQRTAREGVADALAVGYRALECAEFYGNEAAVGAAIAASNIPRAELFLCSKVWTTTIEQGPAAVRAQLERTLQDLQTDYLDLYLM